MRKQLSVLGLIAGCIASLTAHAEVAASVDLGTTGLGAHVSVPVQPNLNARFGVNGLNYSNDTSISGVNYDLKLKLRTVDALLDWFPTANQFRVTGGLVYNNTKIDAAAKPNGAGQYVFNGVAYNASDIGSANGTIDFNKVAPYLGIGWGNPFAQQQRGWSISSDLGILFQGSPSTHLNAVCGPTAVATPGGCATLQANVAAEQASLNDKAKDYRYYPVVRISANYRF